MNLAAACCCAGGGGTIGPPGPPNTCNTFDWCADPSNAGVLGRLESWSQTGSRLAKVADGTTDPAFSVSASQVREISSTYLPSDPSRSNRFEIVLEVDIDWTYLSSGRFCGVCQNGLAPPEVTSGTCTRTIRTWIDCSFQLEGTIARSFDITPPGAPGSTVNLCPSEPVPVSIFCEQRNGRYDYTGPAIGTCNALSDVVWEVTLGTEGGPSDCSESPISDWHRITLRFGIN